MSLYTVADLKAYLRVEHGADDALLSALALSAVGMIESYLQRPILSASRTVVDVAQPANGGQVGALLVPTWPIGAVWSVVHDDGEVLDVSTLAIGANGMIRRTDGTVFRRGPWSITVTVGLEHDPYYAERVEPVLQQAVRDVVADLYLRRNPAATAENEGGGVSQSYGAVDAQGIPLRTAAMLRPWRLVGVAA